MKHRDSLTTRRWLLAAVGGALGLSMALAMQLPRPGMKGAGPTHHRTSTRMHFAVGDFDGDWKPDLAVLEFASRPPLKSNYSVHLQFSSAAELSIGVNGPFGGLRIAARDVNGDNRPDLIVTSVLEERVVAVLLNEGHGRFSLAEPAAYSAFAKEPDVFFRGFEVTLSDELRLVSLRYSFGEEGPDGFAGPAARSTDSLVATETSRHGSTALHANRGRSPPRDVFPS